MIKNSFELILICTLLFGFTNHIAAEVNAEDFHSPIIRFLSITGELPGSSFGGSVSTAGDVNDDGFSDLIVGASNYGGSTGRAYIYFGGIAEDTIADVIMTGDSFYGRLFGGSVASAGDVNGDGYSDVIVGALLYNGGVGRAYIYFGGVMMDNIADIIMTGATDIDYLGSSVSSAGDVNNDGFSDVIVGTSNSGAFVYLGGESMDDVADVILSPLPGSNYFGSSVCSAGDVNADGFSDVCVGAPGFDSYRGKAFVYFGGENMNNTVDLVLNGEFSNNHFGNNLTSGDVNLDGYSDVVISAPVHDNSKGRVYVFLGGTAMDTIADVIMTGEFQNNRFGSSISLGADINSDGYPDLLVGAPNYNSIGKIYIFRGAAVLDNIADTTLVGDPGNSYFGGSVSTTEDLNGNNNPDIVVGASGFSNSRGKIYLYEFIPVTINIKIIPEGFYNTSSEELNSSDTVRAYIRSSSIPFNIIDSAKQIIDQSNFSGSFKFFNVPEGMYYIVIKHRNSVETWSRNGGEYMIPGPIDSYNFTDEVSKSFGNNLKMVDLSPLRFAIFSGDPNQDGYVNLTDIIMVSNDALNFLNGYLPTDINGDNSVNLTDIIITNNNSTSFVHKITP